MGLNCIFSDNMVLAAGKSVRMFGVGHTYVSAEIDGVYAVPMSVRRTTSTRKASRRLLTEWLMRCLSLYKIKKC